MSWSLKTVLVYPLVTSHSDKNTSYSKKENPSTKSNSVTGPGYCWVKAGSPMAFVAWRMDLDRSSSLCRLPGGERSARQRPAAGRGVSLPHTIFILRVHWCNWSSCWWCVKLKTVHFSVNFYFESVMDVYFNTKSLFPVSPAAADQHKNRPPT